jgi:diaminopimelate epimerase
MRIEFAKMHGAGNDFIVLGPPYARVVSRGADLAATLCRRRTSVGADGLIILEDNDGLFMHYYNSDGSEASFCGNGARCVVLFCTLKGMGTGEIEFGTEAGRHRGEVEKGGVRVSMAPAGFEREFRLGVSGGTYEVRLVKAGVPHAVILLDRVGEVDVEGLGRVIRSDPVFGREGANVDFVGRDAQGEFVIRTYERGVERETLACGSGCVAAALVLRRMGLAGDQVTLRTASGDRLTVRQPLDRKGDTYLVGPAVMVYEGFLVLERAGFESY